ncbi:MAG: asparagine synthase (glutamine-hydrolyzing), partial [Bifidobacteriaceae bacterium]|nr:asparagine synthase (glutamine-hydrolyzing) [Bifidobacteriaceae bacterium]
MCGIAGFIDIQAKRDQETNKQILRKMTDIIAHRGPDSEGYFVDEHAAIGFRRLSIIDLDGGSQPIYNEDQNLLVTFNGEIYNFQPLREELIQLGHTFTTRADTEVILHGYEQWGKGILQRLRGMFTFVIWDREKQELFGARDHFGIKPFYYALMNGTFLYGSEIKSLLQHPDFNKEFNNEALKPYLTFQYSALRETFFKGVFKLPEGHYFTLRDGELNIQEYWDCDFKQTKQPLNAVVNNIDETVKDSVKAHQIADVEVGSFLSSGVDSSYVAAVARPEHTYSIGFGKGTYNESQQAKELADLIGLNNTTQSLDGSEAFAHFRQIQWYLDEPDANPSCVPLFFLSALAAKDLRVVLSGEGADELFGGYIDYGMHTSHAVIKWVTNMLKLLPTPIRHSIGNKLAGKTFHGAWHMHDNLAPAENYFIGQAKVFSEQESAQILQPAYCKAPSVKEIVSKIYKRILSKNLPEIKKKQYLDIHQWMPGDILLKADKLTMAHSLELRVPLLDTELMKVAQDVPAKYLLNDKNTKYAFRKAAAKHLPQEWWDREKLGFPVPIKNWLREEKYYKHVRSMFEKDYAAQFFDQKKILKMIDDNYT